MGACRTIVALTLVFLASLAVAKKSEFTWQWRNQEVIGREDASVGNTSKLTEPERIALIDAIVLRLQKPMGDAGYDDDRIREIATTTRIRFIDVGTGPPLIFTTSIGLEGGCDAMGNCPFWVFRRTDDGFLSLLNTIAASYTPQPADSGFEVVFMHHLSAKESGLAIYRLEGNKLESTGCYTAVWPKPSHDPAQLSDPTLGSCKALPLVESAHPASNVSEPPSPAAQEPAQPEPSAEQAPAQPDQETAQPKQPQAPANETPKPDQPQGASDQSPPSPQIQPEQTPPPDQTAPEPKAPAATGEQTPPPPPDQPASNEKQESQNPDQAPTPPPAGQPSPDAKQEAPQPDQAPPTQQPPDAGQPAPDNNPTEAAPKQDQPAPDAKQETPKQDQPAQEAQPANPDSSQPQAPPSEPPPSQTSPN
jgi:hypothetical protein